MTIQDSAARALWKRGNLSYKLHSGQELIYSALNGSSGKLFVGNCSRQFGKSFALVCRAVELALKEPNARIKYATAFLTDLEEFIQPNFYKILEDCPASLAPSFKAQKSKWIFPNGSEIKLIGLDKNPDGLRGNTIDMIILDECGFMANLDYLYKSVIIPATTHRPKAKVIMISTPPKTPAHEFADYAKRAEVEGNYIRLTVYDNPLVSEATIMDLMKESGGEDSTTWKREYLCQFVTDRDSQIIPEWKDDYVVAHERDEFFQFYHLYVGMDLGVKDFTVVLFAYYDFLRAKLVIEDEVKLNGPELTTLTLKDSIIGKETELWPNRKAYRRISDNTWPILLSDLTSLHGLSFISTDKDSLEAMINEVRLMVNKGQIEVHPRCLQLIGCLKYGVWDKSKKKFDRSTAYGHYDALAALIYLVRYLDKAINPVPATYGFNVRNAVIKHTKHQSEGAKMLGKILHKPTRKI